MKKKAPNPGKRNKRVTVRVDGIKGKGRKGCYRRRIGLQIFIALLLFAFIT